MTFLECPLSEVTTKEELNNLLNRHILHGFDEKTTFGWEDGISGKFSAITPVLGTKYSSMKLFGVI